MDKCIAGITAFIAIALAAWLTIGTQSDYEQYGQLARLFAEIMLWTLWLLTLAKFGIKNWRKKDGAVEAS